MHVSFRTLHALLPLGILMPAGAAQEPGIVPTDRFPAPDRVLHDVDDSGALWAKGTTYKAAADSGGFRFVPFLGSDAPRNYPVAIRLADVRVGGAPVALDDSAVVSRSADVWTLDRGPVDVVYRLALDSVEQVVVVDDVSSGGHVRASFEVTTDLVQSAACGGFRFSGAWGEVHYGAAIAIAPDGRSCHVQAVATEVGFDLVVPPSFVESVGRGPLVIDPVLSSGSFASGSERVRSTDVASDEDVGFIVAVEREFSSVDSDVVLYTRSSPSSFVTGTLVGAVDLSSESWSEPRLAGRDDGDEVLTVATRGDGAAREIVGRVASAPTWSVGPRLVLDAGRESYSPDVGADFVVGFFASNRWFVVWEEVAAGSGTDVQGRVVYGGGALGPVVPVATSLRDESAPVIGERAGPAGPPTDVRFTVAYLSEGTIGNEVRAQQHGHDGTFVPGSGVRVATGLAVSVDVTGPIDVLAPNGEHPYLVAFETRALFGNDRFVRTMLCAGGTAFETTSVGEMSDEGRDLILQNPTVAADGDRFLVVYEERSTPGGPSDLVLCSGSPAGGSFGLSERRQFLSPHTTNQDQYGAAMATLWEGGGASPSRGFATFFTYAPTTVVAGAVVSARNPICGYQYCEANVASNGRKAWITAYGDGSTTSSKLIRVVNAPAGTPCFLLVADATGFVPYVGGGSGNLCLGGGNFGRYSNDVGLTDASGAYANWISPLAIPQPGGTVAARPGETWYFQAWFRDFDGVLTSNLSNGVAIPFD